MSKPSLPFDPFAFAKATGNAAMSLAMRPQDLMQVQMEAAEEWGDFWIGALSGKAGEAPRDRGSWPRRGRTTLIIAASATLICWPRSSFAKWSRWAAATSSNRRRFGYYSINHDKTS